MGLIQDLRDRISFGKKMDDPDYVKGKEDGVKKDKRGTYRDNGEFAMRHSIEELSDGSIVAHSVITNKQTGESTYEAIQYVRNANGKWSDKNVTTSQSTMPNPQLPTGSYTPPKPAATTYMPEPEAYIPPSQVAARNPVIKSTSSFQSTTSAPAECTVTAPPPTTTGCG